MEFLECLELIVGFGIVPIGIIRILRINSRILRIPKNSRNRIARECWPGNDFPLILRIAIIPIGIIRILRINSRN